MKIVEMIKEKTAILLFRELDEVDVVAVTLRSAIEKTKHELKELDKAMQIGGHHD